MTTCHLDSRTERMFIADTDTRDNQTHKQTNAEIFSIVQKLDNAFHSINI